MNMRWICGLALVILLLEPCIALSEESDVRLSLEGYIYDDEPVESLLKRNLELRQIILTEAARDQPVLHLGEVAFDPDEVLPVLQPVKMDWWGPWLSEGLKLPRIVQLKNDSVLMEYASRTKWVNRANLITVSQLETASSDYLNKHPDEAPAYVQRAFFRGLTGKWDDALSDATRAIKLRPKSTYYLGWRAGIWLFHKEITLALDDFETLIALDKDNADVYLLRAGAFLSLNDSEGAILDLNEAIRLGSKQADVFAIRGCLRSDTGDDTGAVEDFTRALEYVVKDEVRRSEREALIYHRRACSYAAIGRLHAAIAEFTLSIELKPSVATVYRERGDTYASLEEDRLALADYAEAIRLQPDNSDTFLRRGELRIRAKEYDQAIDDFSAVIALEPRSYEAWMWRAYARRLNKDFQEAIADLTQAHFVNRKDIRPLEALAGIFDKLGETAKANADRDEIRRMKRDRATQEEFRKFLR